MDKTKIGAIEKPLLCIKCGSTGSVVIEDHTAIATSNGFYLKVKHPTGMRYQIACAVCETVQPYPS